MDLFVTDTLTAALYRDSLASSHPISVPVHNPAEINEIFDTISYKKVGQLQFKLQCCDSEMFSK